MGCLRSPERQKTMPSLQHDAKWKFGEGWRQQSLVLGCPNYKRGCAAVHDCSEFVLWFVAEAAH